MNQGGVRPLASGEESLFYLSVGPMAAFLLGVALIPLRGFTTASNFTLVFMALTIAVAEFGGRSAAMATALSSALSLNFFLTQPYLRLTIAGKDDIIAFVGLAVCGLIAAAFGSKRGQRIADLDAARRQLELFHLTATQRPLPDKVVEPDSLLPTAAPPTTVSRRHLPLPPEGARLALRAGDSLVGWLDVWGNGAPASLQSRHALSDVARLLASLLAR